MSLANGMAALQMRFSDKIPRTEYSASGYPSLVEKVTGIHVTEENKVAAAAEFIKKWDYAFEWHTNVYNEYLSEHGGRRTFMGHAVYQEDGSDFKADLIQGFASPEEAIELDPCKEYGEWPKEELIRRFEKTYADYCKINPDTVNTCGVYISMVSGLIEIFGFEILLYTLGMYPKEFNKVIDGYYHWVKQFFDAFAATSIPVIMVHDDLCWTEGPFMPPEWYRKEILPKLKKLIEPLKTAGKLVMFTSDGTIDEFFDDIVDFGVDSVVMEPTSDIRKFLRRHGKHCGAVGGIDCRDIASGSREQIEKTVRDMLDFGREYPGYIFACGNHLPQSVPVENALYYNEMYEKYCNR